MFLKLNTQDLEKLWICVFNSTDNPKSVSLHLILSAMCLSINCYNSSCWRYQGDISGSYPR